MDNRVNPLHELFSRGSTPPVQPQPLQPPISNNSSPNQIDSLFHHLTTPSDHQHQSGGHISDNYGSSASVTSLLSLTDEPITSSASNASATNADRQSALLSLLGSGPSTFNPRGVPSAGTGPAMPQQVPTPPGSSQRSGSGSTPTHNETQGKFLLEQLMAGNPPRSNYTDTQTSHSAPSPPYAPSLREAEYRPYKPEPSPEVTQRAQAPQPSQPSQQQQQQQPPPPPPQQQQPVPQQPAPQQPVLQQQQQQTPSPRKSMFDFVSPFDHLSTSTSSIKKKPVPPQPPSASSGNEDSGSWTAISDPKRQSVENLLEHLSRGQPQSLPTQHQPPLATYEPFDFSQAENLSSRVPPPPLPPKPVPNLAASPRSSPPPKTHAQRTQGRSVESPASQHGGSVSHQTGNRRDKESSPVPRGGGRGKGTSAQSKFPKNQLSPSPPPQTIVFDVSQALDDIQASHDSVKSTAIALVKQDSVFLPGTTIGATHWVAYAMTRGRVRVISRSSGDRTLLQLPSTFPISSSVIDMAVHGNRLAGVTSDGGFVVWELPEIITDDVPGQVLLCVQPSADDGLHAVKWHPKDPDTLAVASENKVYLIDLVNTHPHHRGQPLPLSNLPHIAQVFTVSSPVVSFDFDVLHYALATISVDSTLTVWNIHDQLPYTTHKIRGDDMPSSLTFVDGGIVVGRRNGTIFQLLSITTKQVLSTIKFINGNQEDNDMFGHASYDSRIQTLWVANCRRESLIAFKINLESTVVGGEEAIRGGFDQVVEFAGPKPTIHFVILTADADPTGDEAHAACVAAKVPPGELALVAFSVHSSGVDQVLIRKEWFDSALSTTVSKLPPDLFALPSQASLDTKNQRQIPPSGIPAHQGLPHSLPPRSRTPASEDGDFNRDDPKMKGKAKTVNWKEKEEQSKDKDKNARSDASIINDSSLGLALSREIRKTEESLHTRIGRLIGKEMDKQHQRMEDARAHEQAEDFARQEKILKLISTELTRNTTRVVEMAVKSEVQNSVLPSLETITKNEVKAALNDQIGRGLVDFISQSLPGELEKLLFRADISAHFAHILSTNLTPLLGGHVHEAMSKTFVPLYNQQMNRMHQELSQELRHEIHGLKAELMSWQRDLFRNQETSIRELEHTVRTLSDHVKFLSLNATAPIHNLQQPQTRNSPGAIVPPVQGGLTQLHPRQMNPPVPPQAQAGYGHKLGPLQQQLQPQQSQQPPQQSAPVHQSWYSSGIAAPQASHPATIPQAPPPPPPPQPQPQPQSRPESKTSPDASETWESVFLPAVLSEDLRDLQILLSRTNADVVMPLDRPGPLSQPVILTAMHRLAAIVCASPPNDESFKNAMWWLQRGITVLDPKEQIVMDYLPNVVPGIYTHLNMTKQRLGLPGGPPSLEKARASVSDVLAMLRRKGLQGYEGMDLPKK
ncbi:hypothetical protein FPV67DRAFT_1464268 [Lyophyllum atratum]|nr:hypothetical protein FPV67DRAFT_1464268 [Lyophyllum atratum]